MKNYVKTYYNLIAKSVLLLLAVCIIFLLSHQDAYAAVGQVTGIEQTSGYADAVDIKWKAVSGENICYNVYISTNKDSGYKQTNNYGISGTTKYIYNGCSTQIGSSYLAPGKTYYVKVQAYEGSRSEVITLGAMSQPYQIVTRPDSTISKLQQTGAKETGVTLKWSSASGANCYVVRYYKYGNSAKEITKVTTKTSITLSKLSKNAKYYAEVMPARKNSAGYVTKNLSGYKSGAFVTLPTKITGVKCVEMTTSKSANFQWSVKTYADGYQYVLYNYKGKKLNSGTGTVKPFSTYVTIKNKNLKVNQFYGIKVRAYIKTSAGKKYGKWSSLKYFAGDIYSIGKRGITFELSSGKLKVSWKKVTGATSYDIYISKQDPFSTGVSGMTKVKNVSAKKLSYTLTKFKGKKISKKTRYYIIVRANKKVGKTTYRSTPSKYVYNSLI